jgi:hypothetical protein
MAKREWDDTREDAWHAAKQAVHVYAKEPTARNAATVAAAWRHVRQLAAVHGAQGAQGAE